MATKASAAIAGPGTLGTDPTFTLLRRSEHLGMHPMQTRAQGHTGGAA